MNFTAMVTTYQKLWSNLKCILTKMECFEGDHVYSKTLTNSV